MSSPDPSDDSIAANVRQWTRTNEEFTDPWAERHWREEEIRWGVFGIPESEIGCLGDVDGLDVVELGCGTAYFSSRLARLGARPVGVDPTPAQLATARRMQAATGIAFPLVEAPGEDVPLPDGSFDLAFSEYGASLWADPEKWVPEAARLLRPGGLLAFLTNSMLVYLCSPDTDDPVGERLLRPQFGETTWVDWRSIGGGIEFHLSHGEWIALLGRHGFTVEALHELRAPEGWETGDYYDWLPAAWARSWPAEDLFVARKA